MLPCLNHGMLSFGNVGTLWRRKKGIIESEDYGRELSGGVPPTDEPTSSFLFDPIFLRNGPHNFLLM